MIIQQRDALGRINVFGFGTILAPKGEPVQQKWRANRFFGSACGCNRPNGTSCIGSLQIYLRESVDFLFFYCKSIDKVFTY